MASGKRASMREGPLAQLFRKTEEDDARPKEKPRQEEPPRKEEQPRREDEPKLGRPLPEGGPAPQVTKHVPEPQGQTERMTEAAKRADEREARRVEREGRYGHHEGIPTPEERLKAVFSARHPREHHGARPGAGSARADPRVGAVHPRGARSPDRARPAGGRRGRRGRERRQPDDRGRGRGRGVPRREHRRPVARGLVGRPRGCTSGTPPRAGSAPARTRTWAGPRPSRTTTRSRAT